MVSPGVSDAVLSKLRRTRQRIAALVIPERRSLIRDRNELKRLNFLRSRLALRLAGMKKWSNRRPRYLS